ncbi:hypothetical protein [Carnobacterium maltaromaticum]
MRKGLHFIGKLVFFMDFSIQSAKINKDTYFFKINSFATGEVAANFYKRV